MVPDAGTTDNPRREYRSPARAEQARRTRAVVIHAAGRIFLQNGYAASTMRAIAAEAGVSVPTIELLFGTKPQLLKAAVDVAIAGDDEQVPVLQRAWAMEAKLAETVPEFLQLVGQVLQQAQARSAGLIAAAYDAANHDDVIADYVHTLEQNRAVTVGWIVDGILQRAALRPGLDRALAVDTVWLLMDPVVFRRLTRQRGWTPAQYREWFADSVPRLLLAEPPLTESQVRPNTERN
jgi:AcrR family transcriptional regulator